MLMTAVIAKSRLHGWLARIVLACFLGAVLGGFVSAVALSGKDAGTPASPVMAAADAVSLVSAAGATVQKTACCKDLSCQEMQPCAWHEVAVPVLRGRGIVLSAPSGSGGRVPPQLGPPRRRIA